MKIEINRFIYELILEKAVNIEKFQDALEEVVDSHNYATESIFRLSLSNTIMYWSDGTPRELSRIRLQSVKFIHERNVIHLVEQAIKKMEGDE